MVLPVEMMIRACRERYVSPRKHQKTHSKLTKYKGKGCPLVAIKCFVPFPIPVFSVPPRVQWL